MRRGRFLGLRFQRRIRVLPGVHINLSLSGIGVSLGARGGVQFWPCISLAGKDQICF